ncbi:condensation domain-containing protein, partial [Roseateles sp. BYS180W]
VLPALPQNANGKLDRAALPRPEFDDATAYEAPRGALERTLAALWAEVLKLPRVGRLDNFFALGGDSLLSLRLVALARKKGLAIEPRQMFEHQRLAALAQVVAFESSADASSIPLAGADERRGPGALSFAQGRQWFLWQLDPQSNAYHVSGGLRLTGRVDESALAEVFEQLVRRHAALRTVYRTSGSGDVEPQVLDAATFTLEVTDLQSVDASVREAQALDAARSFNERPFDLEQGPLLRVGLIRLGQNERLLVVVMHHIASDGWSMQIIVDEFAVLYRARVQGIEPALAPLSVEYVDYAVWQRRWLEAGAASRELAYWTGQLGVDAPALQLPTDHPRSAGARLTAALHQMALSGELTSALHRRASALGMTPFMLLLAAWQGLLHRWTGQNDIRVGVPIANRHRAQTESVVGFFVNTQVLRAQVDPRMSLTQLLEQAREAALGAQAHQDLPFEQLVEALQPDRIAGQHPLFQVMFNHARDDYSALQQQPELTMEPFALPDQAAQFELSLETNELPGGGIAATWVYAKELFEPSTIERLGRHYVAMLQTLIEQPLLTVSAVPLMGAAEQAQLASWDTSAEQYADEQPVHRLIEAQVRRTPEAVALLFGDVQLSYAE